jgi:hypothetical protein
MASKRTVTRRGSNKRREAEAVLKLSRKAKAEVAKLLTRNRAGTITRVKLDAGLKEVEEKLKGMTFFVRQIL